VRSNLASPGFEATCARCRKASQFAQFIFRCPWFLGQKWWSLRG